MYSIQKQLIHHKNTIEDWFATQWKQWIPPFYSSMDIRDAGFKLASVDTNLFPAGFNNLQIAKHFSWSCFKLWLEKHLGLVKNILIIPENHTRNAYYQANLQALRGLLDQAGFVTYVHYLSNLSDPLPQDIEFDLVLLNNDLSAGIPDCLKETNKPICPSPYSGWSQRLKSDYFEHYKAVAYDFSKLINIDFWHINPLFSNCGAIDFMKSEGQDCLIKNTVILLEAIQEKYTHYGIHEKPFVVVKSDAGTYGMGVMMVSDPKMIINLNRRQRTRMAKSKGGRFVSQVIIQEGIPSLVSLNPNFPQSETTIYMLGSQLFGGFIRTHPNKGAKENLNAPGMQLYPLDNAYFVDAAFYAYYVAARLAVLAAARECFIHYGSHQVS